MKREISSPHDKLFKQLLGEPENAASFLANNLPGEIVSQLDLNTLQVVQVSFIDTQFIQSEADLLFSVMIANRPGYVYFLFEHQSSPDTFMMLRLLGYMVRVWKRFQQQNEKCGQLPVIIPMVLFHGPKGWKGPLAFQSLVDIPAESFVPYTPEFKCKLFDLSPFGKDQLAGNAVIRILSDLLEAFGRPDFEQRVRKTLETLNELGNAPSFARLLEIIFRYILQVFDMEKEQLGNLVAQALKPEAKEILMTTYEQLIQEGRQEGERIGRQEGELLGRQEGVSHVLAQLLAKKYRADLDELMPLLGKLNAGQQEELIEKILQSPSLKEITDWLKLAGRN